GKPLLLIGKAGTGKTFLLNSISEALGLEHRHYNASLIAFDDLVGFPYPEEAGDGIRYIETPATVWQAESVLIDEISRCKPEHQNRLFSLVHERRIQGLKLERLNYCWAAMNPCSTDQGIEDYYDGSVPLDQALADRFAFVVEVPDWDELGEADREQVADPQGDGAISRDEGRLARVVRDSRTRLPQTHECFRPYAVAYAVAVANALKQKRVRLSPRRVRVLAGNLLALTAVQGEAPDSALFFLGLRTSLPQPAWGVEIPNSVLRAAHEVAWDQAFLQGDKKWLNDLILEPRLDRKIEKLITQCPDEDIGAVAVQRLLAVLNPISRALFAFSLYPAVLEGHVPVGSEGAAALAKTAQPILEVEGEISWQEGLQQSGTTHPEVDQCSRVLAKLRGKRKERARQVFYHLITSKVPPGEPETIERDLNRCILKVSSSLRQVA
ncbi:MAG: AAA domain-containing protein, partial [Akkermansiaceae bacterium]|nr:AAA domain-containing protein [Akkermansiaceae bacterium]